MADNSKKGLASAKEETRKRVASEGGQANAEQQESADEDLGETYFQDIRAKTTNGDDEPQGGEPSGKTDLSNEEIAKEG